MKLTYQQYQKMKKQDALIWKLKILAAIVFIVSILIQLS